MRMRCPFLSSNRFFTLHTVPVIDVPESAVPAADPSSTNVVAVVLK